MSKISLSPNVSGTGTLTIAAPNTNSDITLNLPTTMGTNNGSSVVTTDAAGNLGLGVAPSAWRSATDAIQLSGGSVQGYLTNALSLGQNFYFNSSDQPIYLTTAAASAYALVGNEHRWSIAPSGTAGAAISFVQAMTLDASGNLLVGTTSTSAGAKLYVKGSGASNAAARLYNPDLTDSNFTLYVDKPSATTTTSQVFIGFTINAQGTGSGQINANGASQAAFGSFSDARLKENIVGLEPQLEKVMALRPVEFDYKDGSGHQTGFVAQEMQQVYPDAIGEQKGFLTVSGYGKTEARLIKAIQELKAIVDGQAILISAQGAQIAMQSSQLASQSSEIATLTAAVAASKGTA